MIFNFPNHKKNIPQGVFFICEMKLSECSKATNSPDSYFIKFDVKGLGVSIFGKCSLNIHFNIYPSDKVNRFSYIASLIPLFISHQLVGKAVRNPSSIAICIINQNNGSVVGILRLKITKNEMKFIDHHSIISNYLTYFFSRFSK